MVEQTNSSCQCRFLNMAFWSLTAFKLTTWAKKIIPPPILSHSSSPCHLLPQLHGQECSSNRGWHLKSSSDPSLWPVTDYNDIHHLANNIKTTVEPPLHECSFFARYRRRGGPSQPRWRTRPLCLACENTNLWDDLTFQEYTVNRNRNPKICDLTYHDQGSLKVPKMDFFIKLIFEVWVFYKYAKLSFL